MSVTTPVESDSRSSPLVPANQPRALATMIGNAVWSGRSPFSRFTVRTRTLPSGRSIAA